MIVDCRAIWRLLHVPIPSLGFQQNNKKVDVYHDASWRTIIIIIIVSFDVAAIFIIIITYNP